MFACDSPRNKQEENFASTSPPQPAGRLPLASCTWTYLQQSVMHVLYVKLCLRVNVC